MELISRMLEGAIPYSPRDSRPGSGGAGVARMGRDEKAEHLARVPLLADCSRRQLRAVARLAEVVEVGPGTVLTRAGEPGDHFFMIVDGRARAEVGRRRRSRRGPGDFFGEMSLLDGGPRSATVVAETPMRLLAIHRRDFARLLTTVPDLMRSLLATLSRRLRQAEQSLNA
jgi:CRP/FNR family cyclic AMP-dependent transcriptional regulator